jgi:hypothetical protein
VVCRAPRRLCLMPSSGTASLYLQHLQHYEKSAARLYDEDRFASFEQTVGWIEQRLQELHQSSRAYRVAVNQFADWTEAELSDMFPVFNRSASATSKLSDIPMADWPEGWPGGGEGGGEGPHETEAAEELPSRMLGPGLGQGQSESESESESGSAAAAPPAVRGLNWASGDNPLGMPAVPGPRNQGLCGGKGGTTTATNTTTTSTITIIITTSTTTTTTTTTTSDILTF